MTGIPIEVPDLVRRRALANGATGRAWLLQLPEVVESLAARWGVTIGRALAGGSASYVAEATDAAGTPCVVKVALPLEIEDRDAFARAVLVHGLADGRGCARLLGTSDDPPAMLLERLGPTVHDLGMPLAEVLDTVAATLRSFWRPVAPDPLLPTAVDKAEWLRSYITTTWDELGRPCDRAVIDRAVACCDERAAAFDPSAAVLVHGDAHGWNTLAAEGGFKFVDPEGVWSEPAHDLAVPMREYNEPLLDGDTGRRVRERAELLADACGADADAVWQWGFVERVSTGLACMRELDPVEAVAFLEVAARCL